LIAALWAGSLWTIGYLVAPTLFATLPDRTLAGTIAGNLFRIEAWCSVVFAMILVAATLPVHAEDVEKKKLLHLILLMLGCTLIGYFALHPLMTGLRERAGSGGVMRSDMKLQFGALHGISSLFYLIESLLGVKLLLKTR
jgi:hypothetical protein